MPPPNYSADFSWSLWDSNDTAEPAAPFELTSSDDTLTDAVATSVSRAWLLGYKPPPERANGRALLVVGGGGYVQLMVGREGVQPARWLASLGYHAFVLVHRFPNAEVGARAPLDDARRALQVIRDRGGDLAKAGLGILGLSSGGHLAAALLAEYPAAWRADDPLGAEFVLPKLDVAVIGYAPISTNAKGRTIVANKPPLDPPAKQEFYDTVQPDAQLRHGVTPPPAFIVYSGNDPVVPVVNGYRLAEALTQAGGQVELHVFGDAPHGFALDTVGLPVSKWPDLCEAWLEHVGFR